VRGHWAIEKFAPLDSDVTFRDDDCRVRTGNAPVNLATIHHVAQNLLRLSPAKMSMKMKTHQAAWSADFCASIFTS
jgi:predicted transposase YbfD/YdcC